MSKTIKNYFYDKLTFDNLLKAHIRTGINKTNRFELLKFNIDIEIKGRIYYERRIN